MYQTPQWKSGPSLILAPWQTDWSTGEYEPVLPTTENKNPDNEEPRRLTPVYIYGSIN